MPPRLDTRNSAFIGRLAQCERVGHAQTTCMARIETQLAPSGTTTVPKALRDALLVPHGARLRWQLQTDGSVVVTVVHRYVPPSASSRAAFVAKR